MQELSSLCSDTVSALPWSVVGDITFGTNGERSMPRVLQVQFRGIVDLP